MSSLRGPTHDRGQPDVARDNGADRRGSIRLLGGCSTIAALFAFAWAIVVAVTGGFVVVIAGVRISSHRIVPPYLVGLVFVLLPARNRAALKELSRRQISAGVCTLFALFLAVLTGILGVAFGTFTAAGADAFGYLAQSDLWMKGRLLIPQGPVLAMSWPGAAWAFCPLGFRPAGITGVMVPIYAPGLPLLMAALRSVLGETGAYLVVPLCGGAAVYLTFRLGRLWLDRTTGLAAAALVATSPVFLFQLVQPMSDVPVTAFLLLAIVAACDGTWKAAFGSGLAASIAILIRPNLAPLAAPLAAWVFVWAPMARLRTRWLRLLLFAAGIAPLCLLVAWIQFALYGSPLTSGYGRLSDIYAVSNFPANLSRYPLWLLQTHTPFLLLALLAVLPSPAARASEGRAALAWLALVFALAVFLCYAFYIPFEHWSYLRFLLPALPLLITLGSGVLILLLRGWRPWGRAAIMLASVLLVLLYLQAAVRGDAFALRSAYRERFQDVGRFIGEHFAPDAAFISVVQTSNVSYYAHRQTIRYDQIAPRDFDRAVADLRNAGYKPYLLLMADEELDFRARFSGKSRIGQLHCAPRLTFGRGGSVRVFDVRDCEKDTGAADADRLNPATQMGRRGGERPGAPAVKRANQPAPPPSARQP